ncbi:ABC transporter permease [Rhizobium sp. NFACC06-2]|uniref:ABC transporter permease n=1 Tax=Rhizobium sp. NFACC06-2 TaxID=1566264 RepID=UPI000876E07B|nr:ABC transporter permease [Rhizobium sp. NFACC06-2]SCY89815.1 ABC-2 type transport system permease protein [Rhizobium sp. NFACC06-2]
MSGLLWVFRHELRRIFLLRPVFSVMVLAIVLYSVFYPQPYRTEALRDVPIALVDLDGTDMSRQFARRLDASADVSIAALLPDQASAEREVFARNVYGVLVIPKYFERDLLHGRSAPIALYGDASYFLINSRISGAVNTLAKTIGAEVETGRLTAASVDPAVAAVVPDPMPTTAIPLFNPQGGYATYILPAAFVLILQQTLLIGVGLLGTYPDPDQAEVCERASAAVRVGGRLLAYLVLEAVVFSYYLIVLPYLYGIPRLGSPAAIFIVALPFVVAVSGLGMVVARLFRSPIVVQLVSAAIGMPFLFLSGFSWPGDAIPEPLRSIALVVPSTSAINALVNVGQLGAELSDVRPEILTLGGLVAVYVAFAIALEVRAPRTIRAPTGPS